jgi:hypothetical protein
MKGRHPVKHLCTLFLIGGLSMLSAACTRTSPASPTTAVAPAAVEGADGISQAQPARKAGTNFAFTRIPPEFVEQHIAASPDVPVMTFQIDGADAKTSALTQLQFMIYGAMLDGSRIPSGTLVNFRLLYYPDGLAGASTVIGVNDGVNWAPGFQPADFLTVNMTPAFAFGRNKFSGVFALVADVNGSGYRFNTTIQTARAVIDGIEQALVNPQTCDLPLAGSSFIVQ